MNFQIINFIIVLGFNLYWLKDGWSDYKDIYNGRIVWWVSLLIWMYAAWGIYNFVIGIAPLLK